MGCPWSVPAQVQGQDSVTEVMASPMEEELPTSFKYVVVGDEGVGKTCLVIRYTTNVFPKECVPPRFDPYTASLKIDGEQINWELWDTNGQEEYDESRPLSYADADVFIVCFSISDPASLEHVKTKWVPELRQHCPGTPMVLVGTKQDLREDQDTVVKLKDSHLAPVTSSQGSMMAEDVGAVKYMECSALQKTGVQAAFDAALSAALEQQQYCEGDEEEAELPARVKCVLVGDDGVGKTSLLIRYVTDVFPRENVPTKFDHFTAQLNLQGLPVEYILVDTVGQEAYDTLRPLEYPDADVFLICFSTADPSSFESVKTKWVPEVRQHCPETPVILLGTKQDLQQEEEEKAGGTEDTFLQGSELSKELNLVKYVEGSALKNTGVREAFDSALSAALEQQFAYGGEEEEEEGEGEGGEGGEEAEGEGGKGEEAEAEGGNEEKERTARGENLGMICDIHL